MLENRLASLHLYADTLQFILLIWLYTLNLDLMNFRDIMCESIDLLCTLLLGFLLDILPNLCSGG